MKVSGHMYGGAGKYRRFITGADFANDGVLAMDPGATTYTGLIPITNASFADTMGLGQETSTFDASPAAGLTALVTVDYRPDAIIQARISGSGTEGAALPIMTQTSASATVLSSTDSSADDQVSGTVWIYPGRGMEAGDDQWRNIQSDTASVSLTITHQFDHTMAVGERFLQCPYAFTAQEGTTASDGALAVTTTTLLTEADYSVVAGAGGVCHIVNIGMRDELSSYVEFLLSDHEYSNTA